MSTFDAFAEPRGLSARLRALAGLPMRGLEAVLSWHRRRQGIQMLLELDDHLLRDAGFRREEVQRLR